MDQDETRSSTKPTPKLKREPKPLRSEANLRLDSGIQGFPPRKRKKDKKTKTSVSKKVVIQAMPESRSDGQTASDDDREEVGTDAARVMASSSDEEYDYSSSYGRIRQQQNAAIAAKKPEKLPQMQPAMRDLWADDDDACESVQDCRYLRLGFHIVEGPEGVEFGKVEGAVKLVYMIINTSLIPGLSLLKSWRRKRLDESLGMRLSKY